MATQTQIVTLEPGQSQVVAFEVTPAEVGSYSVSVDGLSGSFSVIEVPEADIRVESLIVSPNQVYPGETVTISVTVTNYGNATGSREIVCEVV